MLDCNSVQFVSASGDTFGMVMVAIAIAALIAMVFIAVHNKTKE